MKIIGLTGGIGCGKTTVSEAFASLGVPVVDADQIAHAISEPQQAGWLAIVERWGQRFLQANDQLDRAKLRDAIFKTPTLKEELEACLHPLIFQCFQEETTIYAARKEPYIIWSVPLLLESVRYRDRIDRLIVVDVPVHVQLARVMARGIPLATAQAILASQVSRSVRQAAADDLIVNTGLPETTLKIVEFLHTSYMKWSNYRVE